MNSPFALKPNELTHKYIQEQFLTGESGGKRLPTIEQMAAHLNVSASTVRSVVRRLVTEGKLQTAPGRGTFVSESTPAGGRTLVLATNFAPGDLDSPPDWSTVIYLGAVQAANLASRKIVTMPLMTPPSPDLARESSAELIRRMDEIDMLLLLPAIESRDVYDAFEESGKPVVHVNPFAVNSSANFVSSDFYGVALRVGKAWRATGRKKLLFLGPLGECDFVSSQLFLMGLSAGCGRDVDREIRFTALPTRSDALQEEVDARLDGLDYTPDGIFCTGDIIGSRVIRSLENRKLKCPQEVSVVAGTGFARTHFFDDLTRVLQPMSQIGATAVRLLVHRFENQCAAVPGLYLASPIAEGSTTRPEENALFNP